jgi:hypothetical protein
VTDDEVARMTGWGAPAHGGHTPVSPYQAFDLIVVGADPRVRPGQRLPRQNTDAHPYWVFRLSGRVHLVYYRQPSPAFGGHAYRPPMLIAPGLRGLGHTGGRV